MCALWKRYCPKFRKKDIRNKKQKDIIEALKKALKMK
jgi:hypothetical protein